MYFTTHGMNYSYFPSPHEHIFSFFFLFCLFLFFPPFGFLDRVSARLRLALNLQICLGLKVWSIIPDFNIVNAS